MSNRYFTVENSKQENLDSIFFSRELLKNKNLTINEKYLLAFLDSDINFESNKQLAELLNVSERRLKRIISSLIKKGYLTEQNKTNDQIKEIVMLKKNTGDTCEWCGCKSIAIQKHHFPISRKDGGKETVSICPNCHYEFHCIENGGVINAD